MSFFKKLKDRMFKSSSKLEEGLESIIEDGGEETPPDRPESEPERPDPDPEPEIEPESPAPEVAHPEEAPHPVDPDGQPPMPEDPDPVDNVIDTPAVAFDELAAAVGRQPLPVASAPEAAPVSMAEPLAAAAPSAEAFWAVCSNAKRPGLSYGESWTTRCSNSLKNC